MATNLSSNDTIVELPAISADGLAAIVRTMLTQEPAQAARIRKGLEIVMTGTLREAGETGVYLVESQCQPGTYYQATTFACHCPDHQRRGHGCKHVRACQIVTAASVEASYEQWQQAWRQRRASIAAVGA